VRNKAIHTNRSLVFINKYWRNIFFNLIIEILSSVPYVFHIKMRLILFLPLHLYCSSFYKSILLFYALQNSLVYL
jgi:hypothetical protein